MFGQLEQFKDKGNEPYNDQDTPNSFNLNKAVKLKENAAPQMNTLWRVMLPDLKEHTGKDPSVSGNVKQAFNDTKTFDGDMEDINSRITTVNAPMVEYDSEFNAYFHRNMLGQYGNLSFDIEEYEDGKTREYLEIWDNLIGPATHRHNPPYFYKRDLWVFRLSTTKIDLNVDIFKGVVFNSVGEISHNYDSPEIMKYNVTLTVDDVEHYKLSHDELIERATKQLQDKDLSYDLELGFPPDDMSQKNIFNQLATSAIL